MMYQNIDFGTVKGFFSYDLEEPEVQMTTNYALQFAMEQVHQTSQI